MPVPFEGPPNELSGLAMFLDEQRAALLRKIDGLTDDQAKSRATASQFCLLTLVKHVAFVERRWFQLEVARRDVPGLWPPGDDRELEIEPGDTWTRPRPLRGDDRETRYPPPGRSTWSDPADGAGSAG